MPTKHGPLFLSQKIEYSFLPDSKYNFSKFKEKTKASSSFFSASSSGSQDKDVYPPKIFPSFVLIIINVPSISSHLS